MRFAFGSAQYLWARSPDVRPATILNLAQGQKPPCKTLSNAAGARMGSATLVRATGSIPSNRLSLPRRRKWPPRIPTREKPIEIDFRDGKAVKAGTPFANHQ